MAKTKIEIGLLYRAIDGADIRAGDDRTVRFSFSSEDPYERSFGYEVLSHEPGAVRMERLLNKAPLLLEHDTNRQIGVVEDAEIGPDARGYVSARFGNSREAKEAEQDVKDGIRTHVSVGYIVHDMIREAESDDGPDTYRVTDWEPLEVSIVSIAADDGVGIGRSDDRKWVWTFEFGSDDNVTEDDGDDTMSDSIETSAAEVVVDNAPAERQRQADIRNTAKLIRDLPEGKARDLADQFCDNGKTVGEFLDAVNAERGKTPAAPDTAEIGMSNKEIKRFSVVRAIRALADPNNARLQREAAFEREASDAADQKMGLTAKGIRMPYDVMAQRVLSVGTDSAGGYLKGTDHLAGSFIDSLENKTAVVQLGATMLPGLVGDVDIPRKSSSATGAWVSAEDGDANADQLVMGQVTLTHKSYGVYSDVTRKLLKQSAPSIDNLVMMDLVGAVARGLDLAAIHGSGSSGQPVGIAPIVSDAINVTGSGVNVHALGANGANPGWGDIVELETLVSADNADFGTMAYLTNSKVRGYLKQVFYNSTGGDTPIWKDNELNGYRAYVSNQVTSTVDKGGSADICSGIIFGDFSQLLLGLFGGLDITVNPYSFSEKGKLRIVAFQDMDVAIRHPEAFAVIPDALTS